MDDFNWKTYNTQYREQFINVNKRFFTIDFRDVDFNLINGKIYLIGDSKPLNLTHRCVWEALCNLPEIKSVSELGTGAGYLVAGLKCLLGESVELSASDLEKRQLEFFRELYPDIFNELDVYLLDITKKAIEPAKRPEVVFASTVLMHIKRQGAYENGLKNILRSCTRFAVIMDNWKTHDYYSDLDRLMRTSDEFKKMEMYVYDSSANVAVVISKNGEVLKSPYKRLTNELILYKYFSQES